MTRRTWYLAIFAALIFQGAAAMAGESVSDHPSSTFSKAEEHASPEGSATAGHHEHANVITEQYGRGDIVFFLLVIAFLVFANAFFVVAEFALVRVRRTRIQELIADGNTTAVVVKNAIDHLDDYISATQVGITLASLALGWVGEPFLAEGMFLPLLQRFAPDLARPEVAHTVAVAVAFFIITFLHVVLGELMPKGLALQHPEKMSLWIARPMRLCTFLFWPLILLLNGTSNRLMRLLGIRPADAHSLALSEDEILMLLSESKKAGVVSEDEQRMLQRVFKFHDKTVREIMKPRSEIVALEVRAAEGEIRAAVEQGYSRLPLYDKDLNNIKGIIYVKDLIYTLQDPKLIKLVDLAREVMFVPETKAVPALLREFQRNKVHMAIVVNEFGDTSGLVTLEDVIEEIVGEIQDEYDVEPAEIERASDGTFIFDGKAMIDRLKELFPNYELPEGTFETVAGLVYHLAGRVPKETDVLRFGTLSFKVLKREGRRLRKIAVRREVPADIEPTNEQAITPPEAPSISEDAISPTRRYEAIRNEQPFSEEEEAQQRIAEAESTAERTDSAPDQEVRPDRRATGSSARTPR